MAMWLTAGMAEALEHAAIHARTDLGTIAEAALEQYPRVSRYLDQSRRSAGSGNPSGPEPVPVQPALSPVLHLVAQEPGEGQEHGAA